MSDADVIYKSIISKRDTREYTDAPITDETLHRILTAGRMAGSAKNEQPTRYVVIRDQAQKEALATCGEWTTPLPQAQVVVVVLLAQGSNPFDGGRAAQNLMAAAWAHGVASCPVSVYPDEDVRKVLGYPSNYGACIALAFAYPRTDLPNPSWGTRIPLGELVHREKW